MHCAARGIAIEIVSGDREPAVRAAAQSLGIAEWRAGVTPADKIARIEELKRQGFKVMMVGDGLNDAPALAAAHVIRCAPISAAASEPGHRRSCFSRQAALRPSSRRSTLFTTRRLRLMRQNLWLAVGYSFLAVPIAIAGSLTPLIAASAMSGSSLLVMLNALRARVASRQGGVLMEVLVILVPLALALGARRS